MIHSILQKGFLSGCVILLIIFSGCSTHTQTANPEPQNRLLIPGPGISAVFNTQPEVINEQSPYFDINYIFSSTIGINDTTTYYQHVGIFANTAGNVKDTALLMQQGLKSLNKVMNAPNIKLIIEERTTFKGHSGWRFKYYSEPNKEANYESFYFSIVVFVREGYFVQLVVCNRTAKGKTWEGDPFFDSVDFTASVEPSSLLHKTECSNYFRHNINNSYAPTIFFPGVIRHKEETSLNFQVEQYTCIHYDYPNSPVQCVTMITYRSTEEGAISNLFKRIQTGVISVYAMISGIINTNSLDKPQINVLSQETISWNDQPAELITFQVDYPTSLNDSDFICHSLCFIHENEMIHALTYTDQAYLDSEDVDNCLFDWLKESTE